MTFDSYYLSWIESLMMISFSGSYPAMTIEMCGVLSSLGLTSDEALPVIEMRAQHVCISPV